MNALGWLLGVAVVVAPAVARAADADDQRAADALVVDTSRIVGAEEFTGWFVDEAAYESVRPAMMESVCRATPAARQLALARLQARAREVGDAETLYEQAGREVTDAVDDARRAARELATFARALEKVEQDCPFWVEPEPDFRGRQMDRDRFTISIETGGLVQLRRTAGSWTFGGGGYGRLLPGYGFDGDVTVLLGAEFGGGAMLEPNTEPTEFVINYFPAIPLLVRFHDGPWHYDIEVGGVGLFQADNGSLSLGNRIGGAIGLKALRTRGVLPWAGVAVAYDHFYPSGGRPRAHYLRGGLRVGIMWDP